MNARVDQVETCGSCQPAHEVPCDECAGSGIAPYRAGGDDPDYCPACGGCGSDWGEGVI